MKVAGVNIPDDVRSKISDICIQCMRRHLDKYQLEQNPWQVRCSFIPRNYEDLIPEEKKKLLTREQLKHAVYMLDPVEWARHHVWVIPQDEDDEEGYWTPRYYQEEIIRCTSSLKALRWGRQLGKSLDSQTLIALSDGSHVTAEALYNRYKSGETFDLVAMDQNTLQLEIALAYITDNGYRNMTRVSSQTGFDSITTSNHPYFIWRKGWELPEWVEASDVRIGDRVAVPRNMPRVNNKYCSNLSDSKAELLGYMIGGGGMTAKGSYTFTSADKENVDNLNSALISCGFDTRVNKEPNRAYSYRLVPIMDVREFIDDMGLHEHSSKTKFIPRELQSASDSAVAKFVGAYWATDGWISDTECQANGEIGCSSASRILMFHIRMLLLRFGIRSKVYPRKVKLKGKIFDSWQLTIHTSDDIVRFAETFKIPLARQQRVLSKLLRLNKGKTTNNNRDTVPRDVYLYADDIRRQRGMSTRELNGGSSGKFRTLPSAPSREKLRVIADKLDDQTLYALATSDIFWDVVTSVEDIGVRKSYSITVPGNNTLITDGFITHNTESLSIMLLHRAYTRRRSKQIIFAPQGKHVKLIFGRLRKYIYDSPKLRPRGQMPRDVQTPFEHILFPNGSEIMALTAGTKSGAEGETARGETASTIYFDEGDRLDDGDLDTLIPILFSKKDPKIIFCSTPTGKRSFFFDICKRDAMWRESHYTSRANPAWSKWKEEFVTRRMTHMGIVHEILAEFGEPEAGVFKHSNIEAALKNGDGYDINAPVGVQPNCTYTMGVDWNEEDNAVRIYIVEWKHDGGSTPVYSKPVYKESVAREDYTQPYAVQRVVEINRKWRCSAIFVDRGHGSAQYEMLRGIGRQANMSSDTLVFPDRIFDSDRFRSITSSEKLEVRSPIDGKIERVSYKHFAVNNAARIMEGKFGIPMLSPNDEELVRALRHFIVVRYSPTGTPVYGMSDPKIPDHDLDAWMLALIAFTMTQTTFGVPEGDVGVAMLNKIMNTKLRSREHGEREIRVEKNYTNSEGVAIMDPEKAAKLRSRVRWMKRSYKHTLNALRRGFTGR